MDTVTQEEAIAHLPELINGGREVLSSRDGKPVARIVPVTALRHGAVARKAGAAKGRYLYIAAPLEDFSGYM